MNRQKILIVGGGFGGIKAALELSKGDNSKFDITLVSDQANFRYYRRYTGQRPAVWWRNRAYRSRLF